MLPGFDDESIIYSLQLQVCFFINGNSFAFVDVICREMEREKDNFLNMFVPTT